MASIRAEEFKGQRQSILEDGSGGEQEEAEGSKVAVAVREERSLKDSALPCCLIAVLLIGFAGLAGVAAYVVLVAFNPEAPDAANATALH